MEQLDDIGGQTVQRLAQATSVAFTLTQQYNQRRLHRAHTERSHALRRLNAHQARQSINGIAPAPPHDLATLWAANALWERRDPSAAALRLETEQHLQRAGVKPERLHRVLNSPEFTAKADELLTRLDQRVHEDRRAASGLVTESAAEATARNQDATNRAWTTAFTNGEIQQLATHAMPELQHHPPAPHTVTPPRDLAAMWTSVAVWQRPVPSMSELRPDMDHLLQQAGVPAERIHGIVNDPEFTSRADKLVADFTQRSRDDARDIAEYAFPELTESYSPHRPAGTTLDPYTAVDWAESVVAERIDPSLSGQRVEVEQRLQASGIPVERLEQIRADNEFSAKVADVASKSQRDYRDEMEGLLTQAFPEFGPNAPAAEAAKQPPSQHRSAKLARDAFPIHITEALQEKVTKSAPKPKGRSMNMAPGQQRDMSRGR